MNNDKSEHQRALARERQRRRRERLRTIERDMKIQINRLSHQIELEEMNKNEINDLQQRENIRVVPSLNIPEFIYQNDKKLNEAEKKNHKPNVDKIEHQRALARERQRRRRERLSEMEKDVIKETDRLSHLIKLQKMSENERLVQREIKRLQQQKRREGIRASIYRLESFQIPKMLNEREKYEMNDDKIERRRTLARERQRRRRERLKRIERHAKKETEQILLNHIERDEQK